VKDWKTVILSEAKDLRSYSQVLRPKHELLRSFASLRMTAVDASALSQSRLSSGATGLADAGETPAPQLSGSRQRQRIVLDLHELRGEGNKSHPSLKLEKRIVGARHLERGQETNQVPRRGEIFEGPKL
jgi:hypothetical protein